MLNLCSSNLHLAYLRLAYLSLPFLCFACLHLAYLCSACLSLACMPHLHVVNSERRAMCWRYPRYSDAYSRGSGLISLHSRRSTPAPCVVMKQRTDRDTRLPQPSPAPAQMKTNGPIQKLLLRSSLGTYYFTYFSHQPLVCLFIGGFVCIFGLRVCWCDLIQKALQFYSGSWCMCVCHYRMSGYWVQSRGILPTSIIISSLDDLSLNPDRPAANRNHTSGACDLQLLKVLFQQSKIVF